MAYSYDVFLSYRRQRTKSEWLIEHFLPLFEEYLSDEIIDVCGRAPRQIFFDQAQVNPDLRQFEQRVNGIEPGADWKQALTQAITQSCCMVGIWSPGYFFSEWCCIEWRSFSVRQKGTQLRTVVPLKVSGGKFPQEALDANFVDLSAYLIVGEGFKKTEQYVDFQKQLKTIARSVAVAVNAVDAAPFAAWPVETSTSAVAVPTPIELTTFANGSR